MSNTRVLCVLLAVFGTGTAFADKVYLTDGRKLSGTVDRGDRRVDLTTEEGQKFTFTRDEVKRVVYESTAAPKEVLDMLEEFEALIAPAFGLVEPGQREFGAETVTSVQRDTLGGRERVVTWEAGRAREPVASDRFVDDWVRYSAQFEAVAKTRRFKYHTHAVLRKESLAHFALYPPEGLENLGVALRDALEAVEETFQLAEAANRALSDARGAEIACDRKIARAENHARKTESGQTATSEDRRQKTEDIGMARAYVQKLRDEREITIKTTKLSADDTVNQVAVSRTISLKQLSEFRRLLLEILDEPKEPQAPEVP